MKLRSLKGSQRELREPLEVKGTYKININQSKVPSVPLVPSNSPHACERLKRYIIHNFSLNLRTLCNLEGTRGTKGTRGLQISISRFPLPGKVPSNSLLEACL